MPEANTPKKNKHDSTTISSVHGTLVQIDSIGVLITGSAGSGKSRLAYALVNGGHKLVADDVVDIAADADGVVRGSAPQQLRGLLHLRHLGIFDIAKIIGDDACLASAVISLVINLDPALEVPPAVLSTSLTQSTILEYTLPSLNLNLKYEQNPASIVELLIKQQSAYLLVPQPYKTHIMGALK